MLALGCTALRLHALYHGALPSKTSEPHKRTQHRLRCLQSGRRFWHWVCSVENRLCSSPGKFFRAWWCDSSTGGAAQCISFSALANISSYIFDIFFFFAEMTQTLYPWMLTYKSFKHFWNGFVAIHFFFSTIIKFSTVLKSFSVVHHFSLKTMYSFWLLLRVNDDSKRTREDHDTSHFTFKEIVHLKMKIIYSLYPKPI